MIHLYIYCCSLAKSCLDFLWPHGLQHTRLPCPLLSPRVCSNSCPLRQWCSLTTLSSATLFSFWLQSFPASESFPVSPLFPSCDQSIGVLASASVLPMNIQGWFPLGLTDLISWLVQRDSQKSSPAQLEIIRPSAFSTVQLSRLFMTPGRTIALARWTFVGKVMSLLYNRLSRCVIAFFPRSKCLLISRLQSLPAVILKPKKIKFVTVSTFSSSICHEVMRLEAMNLVFLIPSFKLAFSLSSFTHQEFL